jgi:hypothetical protein
MIKTREGVCGWLATPSKHEKESADGSPQASHPQTPSLLTAAEGGKEICGLRYQAYDMMNLNVSKRGIHLA